MPQLTRTHMGMGAYEIRFREFPDVLAKFVTGRHFSIYRRFGGTALYERVVIHEPRLEDHTIQATGAGLQWWLGEDDKAGAVRLPKVYTGQTTHAIIDNLLYRETGGIRALNPGTVSTGNVVASFTITYETIISAIRKLAGSTRTEYRINPDFTFDWAGNTNGGKIGVQRSIVFAVESGVARDEIEHESSSFQVADKVYAIGAGEGETPLAATATAVLPATWKDPFNNPFHRDYIVDAPGADNQAEVQAVATAQAGFRGVDTNNSSCTLTHPKYLADFDLGDFVWIYKPLVLEDTTIQPQLYNKKWYPAKATRVDQIDIKSMAKSDWVIKLRYADGTEEDVSKYVIWDDTTEVEVTFQNEPSAFLDIISEPGDLDSRLDEDQTVPAAPAGLTVTKTNYEDYSGTQKAKLKFSWTAVTLNTDGSAITDLDGYAVRYRRVVTSPEGWETETANADETVLTVEDLPVGVSYEAQVQAKDSNGHESAWAPVSPVNTLAGVDTTPPPQPSAPTATGGIGNIYIEWLFTDALGNPMAPDVRWYEVHADTVSTFTPSAGTLKGEIYGTLFSFPIDTSGTYYVKLIAVDLAGNKSIPSPASNGADGDISFVIPDYSISAQQIADAAIDARTQMPNTPWNQYENWSFEIDGDSHIKSATVARVNTNPRTGTWCMRDVFAASAVHNIIQQPRAVPARPGDRFTTEVWARLDTGTTGLSSLAVYIEFLDSALSRISIVLCASGVPATAAYKRFTGDAVAPANTVYARSWIEWAWAGSGSGAIQIDDVIFRQMQYATFDQMVVGDFSNLAENPDFEEVPFNVDYDDSATSGLIRVADAGNAYSGTYCLKSTVNGFTGANGNLRGSMIPCRPGDKFLMECWVKNNAGPGGNNVLYAYWYDENKSFITATSAHTSNPIPTTYALQQGIVTAPANAAFMHWNVQGTYTTSTYIDKIFIHRAVVSAYISDAAILTAHIGLAQISTALIGDAQITTAKIGDLQVSDAKIASVVANKITAGSIVATLTITGGLIRTASGGNRVEMDQNGFRVYDTGGTNLLFDISTFFHTITLRSAASGSRVEFLSDAGIDFYATSGASGGQLDLGWWRDGQGDASEYFRVGGNWSGSGVVGYITVHQKSTIVGSLILYTQDSVGGTEQMVHMDALNNRLQLDGDFGGGNVGRIYLYKGQPTSSENVRIEGHTRFTSSIIYEKGDATGFTQGANSKSGITTISYSSFPSGTPMGLFTGLKSSSQGVGMGMYANQDENSADVWIYNFSGSTILHELHWIPVGL